MVGFIFAMIALFAASTIFIIIRFYRTTATTEAYLTFTVPANPSQILGSKLLVASVWQLLSSGIGIAAIFSMFFISGLFTPGDVTDFIQAAINGAVTKGAFSVTLLPSVLFTAFSVLVGIPCGILYYYCAIMLGQLFNNHRVVASFAMYIAITTVIQIANTVISIPLALAGGSYSITEESYTVGMFLLNYNTSITLGSILNIIVGIACYIVTLFIMKKKLNVR
jgi:hypothetical protein